MRALALNYRGGRVTRHHDGWSETATLPQDIRAILARHAEWAGKSVADYVTFFFEEEDHWSDAFDWLRARTRGSDAAFIFEHALDDWLGGVVLEDQYIDNESDFVRACLGVTGDDGNGLVNKAAKRAWRRDHLGCRKLVNAAAAAGEWGRWEP